MSVTVQEIYTTSAGPQVTREKIAEALRKQLEVNILSYNCI